MVWLSAYSRPLGGRSISRSEFVQQLIPSRVGAHSVPHRVRLEEHERRTLVGGFAQQAEGGIGISQSAMNYRKLAAGHVPARRQSRQLVEEPVSVVSSA